MFKSFKDLTGELSSKLGCKFLSVSTISGRKFNEINFFFMKEADKFFKFIFLGELFDFLSSLNSS